jgi:hypothetical protein
MGRFHDNTQTPGAVGRGKIGMTRGDFDRIYGSSQQKGEDMQEGYKVELYKKKMKISSWRLLEPSKRQLERLT